jgi:hypothetical protein
MWDKISVAWCKTMHKRSTWPIHGRYSCLECGRSHTVDWTASARPEAPVAVPAARVQKPLDIRGTLATMKQYFRSAIT